MTTRFWFELVAVVAIGIVTLVVAGPLGALIYTIFAPALFNRRHHRSCHCCRHH